MKSVLQGTQAAVPARGLAGLACALALALAPAATAVAAPGDSEVSLEDCLEIAEALEERRNSDIERDVTIVDRMMTPPQDNSVNSCVGEVGGVADSTIRYPSTDGLLEQFKKKFCDAARKAWNEGTRTISDATKLPYGLGGLGRDGGFDLDVLRPIQGGIREGTSGTPIGGITPGGKTTTVKAPQSAAPQKAPANKPKSSSPTSIYGR